MQKFIDVYADITLIKKHIAQHLNIAITDLTFEIESQEYGACSFKIQDFRAHARVAKITPTKPGAFVTFWKRNVLGHIEPYEITCNVDILIISTRNEDSHGFFIIPRHALLKHKILTHGTDEGKRAFRVYPPWHQSLNQQALKTQTWQARYFIESNRLSDVERLKKLLFDKM